MNMSFVRSMSFGLFLGLALSALAAAQNRPAPPPPPPGGMPGGASPAAQNPHGHAGHPDAPHSSAMAPNASPHAGVQFGPVGRWWDDKSVVHAVGLSSDQQKRMDAIFSANRSTILFTYQAYLKEQSKLNALSHNSQATQAETFAAIDSVNQARTVLQKSVAQVYMQIRQQMSPEQIQKLEKLE